MSRLIYQMDTKAVYAKPKLSRPTAGHALYPYFVQRVKVAWVNHVWSADAK
jgi:hypothetical protein